MSSAEALPAGTVVSDETLWLVVFGLLVCLLAGIGLGMWLSRRNRGTTSDNVRNGPLESGSPHQEEPPGRPADSGLADEETTPVGVLGYLEGESPAAASSSPHPITRVTFRIGRSSRNDLCLRDASVSRQHAEIRMDRTGTFTIVDLESMNGVYVNDTRVHAQPLQEGDRIDLGDIRLTFTFEIPGHGEDETLAVSYPDGGTVLDVDFSDRVKSSRATASRPGG